MVTCDPCLFSQLTLTATPLSPAVQAFLSRISRQDVITVGCNPSSLLQASSAGSPSWDGGATPNSNSSSIPGGVSAAGAGGSSSMPEASCNSITEQQEQDLKTLAPLCTAVDTEAESLLSLAARVAAGLAEMAPHANTPLKVRAHLGCCCCFQWWCLRRSKHAG